ncbi:MAG: HAMP domain-containing sensor histidine kinase [Candidatus Binatia bacterium]|nr:HAMP domain-containing sensor histidine kinase [Candidatus Binatia bacterium]
MTLANLSPAFSPTSLRSKWNIIDALPIHIASIDDRGMILETNRSWKEFGHPAVGETLLSGWAGDATEPLVGSTLNLGIGELLAGTRDRFEIEYPVRRSDQTVWLSLSAYPSPGGAVVSQTDITERRRDDMRRAQENASAQIDSALARAGQGLITSLDLPETLDRLCRLTVELLDCDASHTIFWQEEDESYRAAASHGDTKENTEAIRNMRLPRTAFVGAVARGENVAVSQVDFREHAVAPLALLAKRLGVCQLLQISLRHGDKRIGFQTACRRSDEPFTEVDERLAARLGQLASLAIENARLVGQLGEASRLKSEFVATVSHELRTPIHVVLGFADLFLDGEFGELSADQHDGMNRIQFGARSLLELSEAALQLTRLDDGQVPVHLEDIDLAELADEAEKEVRVTQRDAAVEIERRIAPDVARVHSDRTKLKLILKSLLSNGLKFTPEGVVSLSAKRRGTEVVLVVKDTGVGIEREALPTIFEAFRQADGSTARRYAGVGLGLHIARRATERLGGSVHAQSTEGEGSRFEVVLPADRPQA